MYVIAVIGDLVSLIPFVNIVSGFITGLLLGIAGSVEDVSLYSDKEIVSTLLTYVGEEIPIISMLPLWTIRVYVAKRAAKKRKEAEGKSES